MRRSEDLVFEIVKNNQALFEDLGTVRALFLESIELRSLVDQIYGFKAVTTAQPSRDASPEELEKWKVEAVRQLQALIDREYGARIEELLNQLSQQLPRE